ncbi:MAG: hypothetical protein AAGH76_14235 [Pseudomonadota bacterium]
MFKSNQPASIVTAMLPTGVSRRVIAEVLQPAGFGALIWQARGTLLKDNWLQKYLPPISPAKKILQVLLPDNAVDSMMDAVIECANLHKQATGAVYSQPCNDVFVGKDFLNWQVSDTLPADNSQHRFSADLSLIVCIVDRARSDRIARAAVAAGAHGPVIHLCEGRGLRDRLGWLRITKQYEKDVLWVMTPAAESDQIFQSMTQAGELHLPGRGFMYQTDIHKGLFNLPSLMSNRYYAANVQQIIRAIDHLTGHAHWRDGALQNIGSGAGSAGLAAPSQSILTDQYCLSAVVRRHEHPALVDLLLDNGAKGVNFTFGRLEEAQAAQTPTVAGAQIADQYGVINSVSDAATIARMAAAIEDSASAAGIDDVLAYVNPVERVATYVYQPGRRDYREQQVA